MEVRILSSFQHRGGNYIEKEVRIVDDATGEYFCRAGWAEDTAGVVPTANPGPTDVVLEVQDVVNQTETQSPGVA